MGTSWQYAKGERARIIGSWECERCGKPLSRRSAIGHHRKFRRYGGKDTVDNCLLTCSKCEREFSHTKGNSEGVSTLRKGEKRNDFERKKVQEIQERVYTQSESLPRGSQCMGKLLIRIEWDANRNTVAVSCELPKLPKRNDGILTKVSGQEERPIGDSY